jgi:hypothetical protein
MVAFAQDRTKIDAQTVENANSELTARSNAA